MPTAILCINSTSAAAPFQEKPASAPAERSQAQGRAPAERLGTSITTATRRDEKVFDVPYTAYVIDSNEIQNLQLRRSTPEAVSQIPAVMGQKTAHGQGSPFMRGFTGYNTLFLIDGIRLNNSTFRSGPNQYWATVDPFSYQRLELVMGPSSVLYGTDAVGGVANAFTNRRTKFDPGVHADGRTFVRWSEAESSFIERVEGSANVDDTFGIFAGVTYKDFGDLRAGSPTGVQPNTGYWDLSGDIRADMKLSNELTFTTVYQHVDQDHVPRTHSTVDGVPFQGTKPGTERKRDYDQTRDLIYGRLTRADGGQSLDSEEFTLYWHRQQERRDRIPNATSRDISGFDVNSPGVQGQIVRDTDLGVFTGGFEYQHDFVQSFRRNFKTTAPAAEEVQGAVGDNAGYDLLGIYLQDQITAGDFEITPGVRYTFARAFADQVDNPKIASTSPSVAGNVINISERWSELTGSVRALYHVSDDVNIFGGVSQAFRAPSLSDLTAFDETSAKEFPSPGLNPERFLQEELGVKARGESWNAQVTYWETQIFGGIIPSPTGALFGTTPVVAKDNTGDGYMHGAEVQGDWNFFNRFTTFAWASWQEGYVDQTLFAGGTATNTRAPISRAMPLSGLLGLRYAGEESRWYAEVQFRGARRQDKLSFKDRTDLQRIPPGGTPGWVVADLRAGWRATENILITGALENIGNVDYRVHGSGINEPGVNFVVGVDVRF